MNSTRERLEYGALRGLFLVCRIIPDRAVGWLGRGLGDFIFRVVRIRRGVALANLRASFPEKPKGEIQQIARDCYRTFASTVVDFARMPRLSRERLLAEVEIRGVEHLHAVAALGRGAILLTGHFGNWERVGAIFPALGHPTRVVVGEQRNRLVGSLINQIRGRMGVGILSAEKDLRGIMMALKDREFVAMVADQDAGRDGIFIDFLGRPASTAVGPVRLAHRFQVPILMGLALRLPDHRYRLDLAPPIMIPEDADESEALLTYTAIWAGILQEYVRQYPDHWLWMHRRWKTRPVAPTSQGKGGEACASRVSDR